MSGRLVIRVSVVNGETVKIQTDMYSSNIKLITQMQYKINIVCQSF
jgi:hypothetical protein